MKSCTPRSLRLLARALAAIAALSVLAGPATAHPHVWVTAASELIYGPDGSVTAIRHVWRFDDMFSTYALQGTVAKRKGFYTREELAPLAQTNVESLKAYGFFTFAKVEGAKQKFLTRPTTFLTIAMQRWCFTSRSRSKRRSRPSSSSSSYSTRAISLTSRCNGKIQFASSARPPPAP